MREWADRMLAWVHVAMRDPADGLYWDHVGDDGRIDPTKWSYNQGNVIGAELAHHRLEAEVRPDFPVVASAPLARAEAVAVAALDHYDTAPDGWSGQGLPFNAVFVRTLSTSPGRPATGRWRSVASRPPQPGPTPRGPSRRTRRHREAGTGGAPPETDRPGRAGGGSGPRRGRRRAPARRRVGVDAGLSGPGG